MNNYKSPFFCDFVATTSASCGTSYEYAVPSCWENRNSNFFNHHLSDEAIDEFLKRNIADNPCCPSILPDPIMALGAPYSFMAGCITGMHVATEYYCFNDQFLHSGYEKVMESAFNYYSKHRGLLAVDKAFYSGFITGTNILSCFFYEPLAETELEDIPSLDQKIAHIIYRMAAAVAVAIHSYMSACSDIIKGIK